MPDTTKTMVKFKYGSYEGFKGLTSYEAGTIYVTTDEQGIYFAKDNVNAPIKLGNIITYNSLKDFNDNTLPPYSAEVFYYITDSNALIKYNDALGKFVQLNKDYGEDVADIQATIGADTDEATATTLWGQIKKAQSAAAAAQSTATEGLNKATENAGEITTIKGNITTINGQITGLDGRLSPVEAAIATGENNLGALRAAIDENATNIGTNTTAISDLDKYVKNTVEVKAQKGVDDAKAADDKAVAARGVADEAKATADANKLAIENETTGLGALNRKVGELASADTQLDGKITTLTNRVKDDEDNLANNYYTSEQIDDLLDSITGTDEEGNPTSIAGLRVYVDGEIDRVEGAIGEVSSAVSGLKSDIGKLSNVMNFVGVAPLTDGETTYETDTAAIEAYYTSKGLTKEVGDVVICGGLEYVYTEENKWEPFGSAEANTAKFEELTNAVNGLDTRLETAEGKVGTLETKVGTLETAVSGHGDSIEAIETDIGELEQAIADVAGDLATEAQRADAAEKALDKKITDLDTAYKTKDGELTTAINNLDTAYKAADVTINGKIDGLTTRLNALDTAETGKVPVLEAGLAAEIKRAGDAEKALDEAYKAADAETKSYIDNALAWGTF